MTWKWRFFQVLKVQEQAETNQIERKVKYTDGRGRYDSSNRTLYPPKLSDASIFKSETLENQKRRYEEQSSVSVTLGRWGLHFLYIYCSHIPNVSLSLLFSFFFSINKFNFKINIKSINVKKIFINFTTRVFYVILQIEKIW